MVESDRYIEIDYQQLSSDALQGIIRDFVLQEGTDYGHREFALQDKMQLVEKQLLKGQARIIFDPKTETCFLTLKTA